MSKWINWEGGELPVPKGTPIWVRHRDGAEYKTKAGDSSVHSHWKHQEDGYDIIAYKLRKGWKFNNENCAPDVELVDIMLAPCGYVPSIIKDECPFDWDWSIYVKSRIILWRPAKSLKSQKPVGEIAPPKEGWIVNAGVRPNLPPDTKFDLITREGRYYYGQTATGSSWEVVGDLLDIIYWRQAI